MSDEKLPSMGNAQQKSSRNMSRHDLQKENSELKKEIEQVDERAAGQEMRERELAEREHEIQMREQQMAGMARAATTENQIAGELPPRVSTDENALREHSQAAIDSRSVKDPLEMGKKFPDITPYVQEYGAEKKLMWINDIDGDVQRWIDQGAEPVPWKTSRSRTFEGITDTHESQWVRIVGGESRSGVFHVYLLMIDHAEYQRIKIDPVKHRQQLIHRAMQMGVNQSDEGESANVRAYAPNLPSGQKGLEQLREVAGEVPGL